MKDLFKSHSTKCKQVESVYFNFTQMQLEWEKNIQIQTEYLSCDIIFFSRITDIHLIKMN